MKAVQCTVRLHLFLNVKKRAFFLQLFHIILLETTKHSSKSDSQPYNKSCCTVYTSKTKKKRVGFGLMYCTKLMVSFEEIIFR